jgi:hypothetical protein
MMIPPIGRLIGVALLAVSLASCQRTIDVSGKGGSSIVVDRGCVLSITLSCSATVSPDYQYSWGDPVITGKAVQFQGYGEDPHASTMPGSSANKTYLLKAAEPGDANILIRANAGAKVLPKPADYTLKVHVQ